MMSSTALRQPRPENGSPHRHGASLIPTVHSLSYGSANRASHAIEDGAQRPWTLARGTTAPALSRAQLLATLRRLLDDDTIEIGDRVAGLLVLLFAQPVARIRSLAVSDLEHQGDELWLHIGAAYLPLPERLALLITELISQRRNMDTAAHPGSRWLFPGFSPG